MDSRFSTADTLVTAERKGKSGLSIPLRIDSVEQTPKHDAWGQIVHCSDLNGVHVKVTVFAGEELAEYSFEVGEWYLFDGVNPDVYSGSIGIVAKWERQVSELEDAPVAKMESRTVRQIGNLDGIAALDIETCSTVNERKHEPTNPNHQEILCIGVGYSGPDTEDLDSTVLFRKDASDQAELELIEETIQWLEEREWEALVTFGGAWFDLPVLIGRAELTSNALKEQSRGSTVRDALESYYHADLSATKNRTLGTGSLEDMAAHVGSPPPETHWTDFDHGLSPRAWRSEQWPAMRERGREPPADDLDDPVVFNSDIPHFGDAWLDSMAAGQTAVADSLFDCIETYTLADIEPLFAIVESDLAVGQPAFQMQY